MADEIGPSSSNQQPVSRSLLLKLRKKALKKRRLKIDKLIKLYKQLRAAVMKLENREISFGDDYNEMVEEAYNRRLWRLIRRQLQIYDYFVRKGIFVDDTGNPIVSQEKPKLIITATGVEDLNALLTEHVNKKTECELFDCKIQLPYRHVTVDDVAMLIEKVKQTTKENLFPEDSSELDRLIQNIVCEVNKNVKCFTENAHKSGLEDWSPFGSADEYESISMLAENGGEKKEQFVEVPNWNVARMEIHEACDRGELDCQEPESADIDDTEMAPTAEEEEEEDEDEDEEVEGDGEEGNVGEDNGSTTECNALSDFGSDQKSMDVETQSDDSCCIIEEHLHEKTEWDDDSDCCIIDEEEVKSVEERFSIENIDINDVEKDLKPIVADINFDGNTKTEVDSDCFIVED